MKFKRRIIALCEKPHLAAVSSSEDIYWFSLGYCFAENKYSEVMDTNVLINNFKEHLLAKFNINNTVLNWGVLLRLFSSDNNDSILIFKEAFLNFENISKDNLFLHQTDITSFSQSLKKLLTQKKFDNSLQLEFFLFGYEIGYYDFGNEDKEFEFYIDKKNNIWRKILKNLNAPSHKNAFGELFLYYYTAPMKGIEVYVLETISQLEAYQNKQKPAKRISTKKH